MSVSKDMMERAALADPLKADNEDFAFIRGIMYETVRHHYPNMVRDIDEEHPELLNEMTEEYISLREDGSPGDSETMEYVFSEYEDQLYDTSMDLLDED